MSIWMRILANAILAYLIHIMALAIFSTVVGKLSGVIIWPYVLIFISLNVITIWQQKKKS